MCFMQGKVLPPHSIVTIVITYKSIVTIVITFKYYVHIITISIKNVTTCG